MGSVIVKRSKIASYASGLLFGAGWWLILDIIIYFNNIGKSKDKDPNEAITFITFLPGIIGTIGFFLVNFLPRNALNINEETGISAGKSLYIIIAFAVTFAGIISGFWVLFSKYTGESYCKYGVFMVMQSLCIFLSTFVFRFGRPLAAESSSF
ncbi:hypothetical protein BCR36DRAFT_355487 [Piromyces finnis]|uniref:Uncharacterized protein n=1 Tax=Piromyces finnis TaxID=1754191 RepID=A0A1Y1V6U9_9FUNG|nr:hypothetical protein BCR36DRAFT_355487 [Piromyces finnis]|eukprot:ORX47945.1 hypothetical protein BCR36DRAFT_355487 [Piromyces finnis]